MSIDLKTSGYPGEPSQDKVFPEKFHSVYVVKGVWSMLTQTCYLNKT